MHLTMLGQSQLQVYHVEHEVCMREGDRRRLLAAAKAADKVKRERIATPPGFIPRLAGALGLL